MAMNKHWQQAFFLWAETNDYLNRLEKTKAEFIQVMEKYRCYVAFSGGKDSTVMLHLALQIDPEISVFHWDYGVFMPRVFQAEIMNNITKLGIPNISVFKRMSINKSSKIGYRSFFSAVAHFNRENRFDLALIGLRKEESSRRRCKIHRRMSHEAYPLAEWTWKDIWAYIVVNNLPYHSVYDLYAPLLGWDKTRFVTFFDYEFEKLGSPYLDGFLLPQYHH